MDRVPTVTVDLTWWSAVCLAWLTWPVAWSIGTAIGEALAP